MFRKIPRLNSVFNLYMNIPNKLNRFNDLNDETMSDSSARRIIEWSYENEEILAEWCDIAQCYKWLNTETYKYYKNVTSYLTIPCIVFSTISGTVSFGIPNVPDEYQYIVPFAIGFITISVGIITTIQQYYRFTELKETHRILAIGWDKLARSIRIELSKAPNERVDARHFIKFTRIEFDHLMENGDVIPEFIVKKFNEKIEKEHKENNKNDKIALKKPDICDSIVSINVNRRIWFPQPMNIDDELSHYSSNYRYRRRKHSNSKRDLFKRTDSSSGEHNTPSSDCDCTDEDMQEKPKTHNENKQPENVGYHVKSPPPPPPPPTTEDDDVKLDDMEYNPI